MKQRRRDQELERDIAEHLAMETDYNVARGMSPSEARSAALRKFGNVALVMEDTRSVWRWPALDTWYADVRHAFRRMRRSPGTAALAVASLALAFAPSVTVFSAMDRLFLTPVNVQASREIVEIGFRDTRPGVDPRHQYESVSYPEFEDFRRSLRSFSGVAYQAGHGAMVLLNGRRVLVGMTLVSEDYFSVLGVRMHSGPGFLKDRPSVVINHRFWMREFQGRPDIIGRTLVVNGEALTIGGVAAPEFRGMNPWVVPELWIQPGDVAVFRRFIARRDMREGTLWARLRPGVSLERASTEVDNVCQDLARKWPATNRYLAGNTYASLADHARGGIALTTIAVLLLGILLAVACANVAGILLARAEERRHETAIRQSLGASRARLIREWMVESAVLSTLAAALGLTGAKMLMNLLPRLAPATPIPLNLEFSFGLRVWLYALSLVFASALTFGLVPAWRGSRPDLLAGLQRDSAVQILRTRIPVRSLLIVVQVAAAEILLFGAGMVLDMVSAVRRLEPGFEPDRPIALAMVFGTGEDGSLREMDCGAVRERLARIPGVRRVTYTRSIPLSGMEGFTAKLETPGREPREVRGGATGPGFLSMIGVRMIAGRDLEAADQHGVVVNATLARQLDPSDAVVGREIRLDGAIRQIVGVFQDAKWNTIYDAARPRAIALMNQRSGGDITFAIETGGDPGAYLGTLRGELAAAQPTSTIASSKTLWQHYRDSLFLEFTAIKLFYGLGLLALALTTAGLHGIASALFARRSKEFAIRLALGATSRQIVGSVLASGVKLALFGLAVGLAVAIPCGVLIASTVHAVSALSAPALGLSSVIVMAAAIAASAQPATRVLRIQPGEIVRAE